MSSASISARTTCRSCGAHRLEPVLSLGEQFVSDFLGQDSVERPRVPLELVLCDPSEGGCGLLQLRHTTPLNWMYMHYWYRSRVNTMMRAALADIAAKASQLVALREGDLVLDIGCNDGTLLRSYALKGLRLVGFEPSRNISREAEVGTTAIINDFFNYGAFEREFGRNRARAITSIAMFYDLDDPNTFVEDAKRCLAPDGIWVIQMSYLPLMLSQNAYDNVCHEHLEYYSLMTLAPLIERHGLRIVDAELNDVNGGSIRVYISHADATWRPFPGANQRVRQLKANESHARIDDPSTYTAFADRVDALRARLREFVIGQRRLGKTIYVYGASTKGNTLLQYCKLDRTLIGAAVERNPDKWGRRTVGTEIPIISEEQARVDRPDYLLVLPWHFLPEFIQRERNYLLAGGQLIVPLPEFRVLGREVLGEAVTINGTVGAN